MLINGKIIKTNTYPPIINTKKLRKIKISIKFQKV